MPRGVSKRAELAPRAHKMRREGLTSVEIGQLLGVARSTVYDWIADPDRVKHAARRAKYAGKCIDCGAKTDGSRGFGRERCSGCRAVFNHENRYWTTERVIAAIKRWADEHGGVPPRAQDWNSTMAANSGLPMRPPWAPDVGTVQNEFGSWSLAIEAAGFTPCKHGTRRYVRDASLMASVSARIAKGESPSAIAVEFDVDPVTVRNWLARAA